MTCPSCGLEHRGWVPCAKARLDAQKQAAAPSKAPQAVVVHTPDSGSSQAQIGSSQPDPVVVHTKHGKYADPDKRKAYRREWMRRVRAK